MKSVEATLEPREKIHKASRKKTSDILNIFESFLKSGKDTMMAVDEEGYYTSQNSLCATLSQVAKQNKYTELEIRFHKGKTYFIRLY